MYGDKNLKTGVVTIHLDDESYESVDDALVDVFLNGFSDPLEISNEGAPVCLGNAYARYEFTAIVDGFVYTYPFGPIELERLRADGELELVPLCDNYLPDMPEGFRPEWAA